MSRKAIRLGIAVPVLALLAAACGGGAGSDDDSGTDAPESELTGDPVVIGLVEDTTGPASDYSVAAGKATREAIDELNQMEGILGRPVEVVDGNDESDPTKAPSIARKLIQDGAEFMITTSSTAAVQAKPVYQSSQVPAISSIAASANFAEPSDNDFTYSLGNTITEWAPVYCAAFEDQGYNDIAILSDASAVMSGIEELLVAEFEDCVNIVEAQSAPLDTSDLNPQVARVVQAEPDAVVVMSVGGKFEVLAHNTLTTQLPDVQRFSLASIGNEPDAWALATPGALEGVVYMGSISVDNPETMALQEKIREWREDPDYEVTTFDAQAYDGVQLAKMAIEAADSTDGEAINEAMQSIEDHNASFGQEGFTLSFGPDKHIGADGQCGLVLTEFGPENRPVGPWDKFQMSC